MYVLLELQHHSVVKSILDKWHWKGWLVIERSRDATDPRDVKRNYGANVAYMDKIFQ